MRNDELVYVLVVDKKIRYSSRRFQVVYIGMTESGVHRVAKSAADRAERILDKSGIHSFSARIVHYPAIDGRVARAWKKRPALLLERAVGRILDPPLLFNPLSPGRWRRTDGASETRPTC